MEKFNNIFLPRLQGAVILFIILYFCFPDDMNSLVFKIINADM